MSNDGSLLLTTEFSRVPKFYLASLGAWLGAYCVGTVISYSSPSIPSLNAPTSHLHLDPDMEAWFGSLMPLGALFGGMLAGKFVDYFGRKHTLLYVAVPFTISWLTIAYATAVLHLLIGRFFTGFCAGIICLASPIYIAETSTAKCRGLLGSGFQLSITMGILVVYCLGNYLPWSWLAVTCAIGPILLMLWMLWMPETPTWLIKQQRIQCATEAVFFLYGDDHNLLQLSLVGGGEDPARQNFHPRLLKKPQYYKPLLLGVALMFFQQFSGINALMFYMAQIFKESHSSIDPNLASIIVGIVQVLFTVVACALVDRMGRRILLITSGTIMSVSIGTMSLYYFLFAEKNLYGWLPLVIIMVFVSAFSVGFGPIPWLIMSEVLPAKIKGFGSSCITAFNWLCIFVLTREFATVAEALTFKFVYLGLSIICMTSVIFVTITLPETKGKSLAEIEIFFKRNTYTTSSPESDE